MRSLRHPRKEKAAPALKPGEGESSRRALRMVSERSPVWNYHHRLRMQTYTTPHSMPVQSASDSSKAAPCAQGHLEEIRRIPNRLVGSPGGFTCRAGTWLSHSQSSSSMLPHRHSFRAARWLSCSAINHTVVKRVRKALARTSSQPGAQHTHNGCIILQPSTHKPRTHLNKAQKQRSHQKWCGEGQESPSATSSRLWCMSEHSSRTPMQQAARLRQGADIK